MREMLEWLAANKGADGLRHMGSIYGKTEDCRCSTGNLCPFLSCPQYDCMLMWDERAMAITLEGH